jgi:hypothetical protein
LVYELLSQNTDPFIHNIDELVKIQNGLTKKKFEIKTSETGASGDNPEK